MLTLSRAHASYALLFLIAVSFFGIALAFVFVAYQPVAHEGFALRQPVAGAALTVVCVLGIFAVLYPASCAGIAGFKKQGKTLHSFSDSRVKVLRGHHATCARYSTHVMHVDDNVFCSSCSGLFVGAAIVLVCLGLFFFGGLRLSEEAFVPVSVGAVCVAAALLYPFVPVKFQKGFTRFFAGVLLPVGSFLVLAGVDEASTSFSVDLFVVVLSVLWLATKMSLSQWEHRKTCALCSLSSCNAESTA